jgi:hypothetical protein
MRLLIRLVTALLPAAFVPTSLAYVYPEHRDLALLTVQGLDPARRAAFDRLWQEARAGAESRLCASGADDAQGLTPECIDWAAFSAISGDHSCSSRQMFETASRSDWILQVADIAAQLKVDLARLPAPSTRASEEGAAALFTDPQRTLADQHARAARINALRTADLRLQRADPEYATRAGSNGAHFLLPRPSTDTTEAEYAELTLKPGAPISALGTYTWFHLSALQKASRLAKEPPDSPLRDALARAALADEAFALHFLEDVFSAGHVAGSWGDVSQRNGTHNYYNENGLEVFTWQGGARSHVLMGDARMRPQDAEIASPVLRRSLDEVLDVATSGSSEGRVFPYTSEAVAEPDDFDVCKNDVLPPRAPGVKAQSEERPFFSVVLLDTPVPALGPGLGALPRFRTEIGPFIGLSGTIDARHLDGGFASGQAADGWMSGLDLSVRVGWGLDGVMNDGGDGLVYAQLGLRSDGPSTNKINDTSRGPLSAGNLTAAIPARTGISTRVRMPFWLIPGDLVLLSPVYLFDKEAYTNMAVTAANGGLIPWQTGWATSVGRFQMVLGRELGVTFYGHRGHDQLIVPPASAGGLAQVAEFESINYDVPIAEYRPYRAFSENQSSSVIVQLFVDFDVPHKVRVVYPVGTPAPTLNTIMSLGLRLVFDWRYYR